MSILSLLTSVVLAGMVYGLSFLPTATLTRPDDEIGLGLTDDEQTAEAEDTPTEPKSRA